MDEHDLERMLPGWQAASEASRANERRMGREDSISHAPGWARQARVSRGAERCSNALR